LAGKDAHNDVFCRLVLPCPGAAAVCTSCENIAKDGLQTDVDCGGGGGDCATRCLVDEGCAKDGDCSTGRCDLMTKLCRALTDSESCTAADNTNSPIENIWETDVNCGGPDCRALGNICALTEKSLVDADCASSQCRATAPSADLLCTSCTDTVKNGVEMDVDCGGADCKGCGQGMACTGPSDLRERAVRGQPLHVLRQPDHGRPRNRQTSTAAARPVPRTAASAATPASSTPTASPASATLATASAACSRQRSSAATAC
jgi:hypothetical protein